VYYSEWTSFQSDDWEQTTEFGKVTQVYSIAEPLITQDVLDHGAVLVYITFAASPEPRPLPVLGNLTAGQTQHLWYRISEGDLRIIFQSLNTNDDPGTFGVANQYRYVIVPGGVAIGSDVQSLSYGEAQLRFGLPPD